MLLDILILNFKEFILGNSNSLTDNTSVNTSIQNEISYASSFDLNSIPEFSNEPYVVLNNNKPDFDESDLTTDSFEQYSDLDSFGRCGVAYANISLDTMPNEDEERGSISSVEPTGWINKKYDSVDGGYLYNRCHLIGYQLSAENANEKKSYNRH